MYCTKCGNYIEDEEKGCPCTWQEVMPQQGEERIVLAQEPIEKPFSNAAKVAIVAVTCSFPFIGLVFGFILSIVFLSSNKQDERSFGKALLILCIIFIAIGLLCCLVTYAFHIFDFLEGYLEGMS